MRNIKGQVYFDSKCPPDDLCPTCNRESSCDCICTADDLAEAADELAIERLEEVIHFDAVAEKMRKEIKDIEERCGL